MIERSLFKEEHEIWRASVRQFVEEEIVPHHSEWEAQGIVPRELWLKAGERGQICCTVPEEYGGLGLDYLFDVVVFEELWRVGASGPGFLIHTDLVATYILSFGTEAQKRHWLPKMVRGEAIGSLGMRAQDNSELFFENVRIPETNMLGGKGQGFAIMMTKLAQERLAQAIRSAAVSETVIDYTAERKAFGQTIADFQNTQFVLADLKARATMARVFTDKCVDLFMQGKLDPVDAAMAKLTTSELHCKVVDKCIQLFGGWGYMWEYPIARDMFKCRLTKTKRN